MPQPPSGLNHPTITLSELQRLNGQSPGQTVEPANFIDFFTNARGQLPYRLVWVRLPSGDTRLYRLVPEDPHQP